MRLARRTPLALLLCGAAACATARKDLGDIQVTATPPRISTQVITHFTFHVTEGRLALESPGNPSGFDLTEEPDGCLRGNVKRPGNSQEVCRLPAAQGDQPGLSRWKSATSTLVFTVQLSTDRSRILVDAGPSHGEFVLGAGAVADELRNKPQLLGAAFAYGYVPRASATDDGPMLDYTFLVGPVN